MTETTIRKATPADIDPIVRQFARAFDDDPFFNWIIRQDGKRAFGFDVFFRNFLSRTLQSPNDEVLTTGDCLGFAIWQYRDTKTGFIPRWVLMLPQLPIAIRSAGLPGLRRMTGVMRTMRKAHPATKRHYYLALIGVDPDQQGQGLGAALMRPVLERCDRESCGAYLESTRQASLAFYERLGFVLTGQIDLGQGAPSLWAMWRDPRS